MNISCRERLLNWLWNGFLNEQASSSTTDKRQAAKTYILNTDLIVKGLCSSMYIHIHVCGARGEQSEGQEEKPQGREQQSSYKIEICIHKNHNRMIKLPWVNQSPWSGAVDPHPRRGGPPLSGSACGPCRENREQGEQQARHGCGTHWIGSAALAGWAAQRGASVV